MVQSVWLTRLGLMGITCWILDCISIQSLPHFLKTSHGHDWYSDSYGDSLLDSWLYFNTLCLLLTFWKLDMVLIHTVIALWHLVCTFCTVLFAPWAFSDCGTSCIPKSTELFFWQKPPVWLNPKKKRSHGSAITQLASFSRFLFQKRK